MKRLYNSIRTDGCIFIGDTKTNKILWSYDLPEWMIHLYFRLFVWGEE